MQIMLLRFNLQYHIMCNVHRSMFVRARWELRSSIVGGCINVSRCNTSSIWRGRVPTGFCGLYDRALGKPVVPTFLATFPQPPLRNKTPSIQKQYFTIPNTIQLLSSMETQFLTFLLKVYGYLFNVLFHVSTFKH